MPQTNVTGSGQVVAGRAIYRGFSISETSGNATARVRIYDGTSATGTILEELSLTANQSAREYYADVRLVAGTGIYLQLVSGTISGSVRWDA